VAGAPEPPEQVALDSTHVKAHRCASRRKRGALEHWRHQGRPEQQDSRVDRLCRRWVLILTPGNTADCMVAPECVSLIASPITSSTGWTSFCPGMTADTIARLRAFPT
jgi:hypothetical protein